MELLGPYRETDKGNHIDHHMHVDNYLTLIPLRSKSTEEVIKAYLIGVYSTFGGSKYILSD